MLTDSLITLFKRDLNKLKSEIDLYNNESNLWLTPAEISNSAGNLTLHIVGNLSHFVGAVLGHTGYVRQRDLEFSQKHVPREEIIKKVDELLPIIEATLSNLKDEDLDKPYPIEVFKFEMTIEYFLIHLIMHLSYHLGQINYHRRLID